MIYLFYSDHNFTCGEYNTHIFIHFIYNLGSTVFES